MIDLDKTLEILHNCPAIGFEYDCDPKPTYRIEQKDLPILFDYIYQLGKKDKEKEIAEEQMTGNKMISHYGCNSNGQHEKCEVCPLTDCKDRNKFWFEGGEK